jgi:hypothetical protein
MMERILEKSSLKNARLITAEMMMRKILKLNTLVRD